VIDLARQLREEAKTVRAIVGAEFREAGLIERIADRIEKAAAQGARDEYVFIADAAAILGVCNETVRRRCQTEYEPAGLAQKRGGMWYVHMDALTGKPERALSRAKKAD
jgi:hypothetical protein